MNSDIKGMLELDSEERKIITKHGSTVMKPLLPMVVPECCILQIPHEVGGGLQNDEYDVQRVQHIE